MDDLLFPFAVLAEDLEFFLRDYRAARDVGKGEAELEAACREDIAGAVVRIYHSGSRAGA